MWQKTEAALYIVIKRSRSAAAQTHCSHMTVPPSSAGDMLQQTCGHQGKHWALTYVAQQVHVGAADPGSGSGFITTAATAREEGKALH